MIFSLRVDGDCVYGVARWLGQLEELEDRVKATVWHQRSNTV